MFFACYPAMRNDISFKSTCNKYDVLFTNVSRIKTLIWNNFLSTVLNDYLFACMYLLTHWLHEHIIIIIIVIVVVAAVVAVFFCYYYYY